MGSSRAAWPWECAGSSKPVHDHASRVDQLRKPAVSEGPTVHRLFSYNPVDVLKDHWAKLGTRTHRYIDKRHIGQVWNALNDARNNPKNVDALAGIDLTLFLLLTGARRNEGAKLTWDRVHIEDDLAKCWWHLPDPKNGREVSLPLSRQAIRSSKAAGAFSWKRARVSFP